ncbi:MAG: MaoC family dehydratase N-terminal domain-containing protein [Bacillota bacterium]
MEIVKINLDKSLIGLVGEPFTEVVEKGAIRKFAEAIGDPNPIFYDEEYAKSTPHGGIIAPPTFPITFRAPMPGINIWGTKNLHGGQEFNYLRPIKAGDKITVQTRIVDVYEKSGNSGKMTMLVTETTGKDEQGQLVYTAVNTGVFRE